MPLSSRRGVTKFIHRKLLFRLRRFTLFFAVVVTIIIYELITYDVPAWIPVCGSIAGILMGLAVNHKMHNITWNAELSKTVTKMDRLGVIILVAYLLFAVFRSWIFSHWMQGYILTTFSLSIAAGGLLGRYYSTRQKIRHILKREGLLHNKKTTAD